MLCACAGERFKFHDVPESQATTDFSEADFLPSTTDQQSKLEDSQVDEAEFSLKESLSLNYEEARALLGRLEYQKGNFEAALQVFLGINIESLTPRMTKAIAGRTQVQKPQRVKGSILRTNTVMSMHSVNLLFEAILLQAKSLEKLGKPKEAAVVCKEILDTVESALPNGIPDDMIQDSRMQELLHTALDLLPKLWTQAGLLSESIAAYRRVLTKPWKLGPQKLANVQKALASMLLYGGIEQSLPKQFQFWGANTPNNSIEEAILLLFILMKSIALQQIAWDPEIMDHLSYALSVTLQLEQLAVHVEKALPGTYNRTERWYFLALCYTAAGQNEAALNLLNNVLVSDCSKRKQNSLPLLMGAELCSRDSKYACNGLKFAHKVIDSHDHFISQAYMMLGICYGALARDAVTDIGRLSYEKEALKSLNHAALISDGIPIPDIIFNLGLENVVQRNIDSASKNARFYFDIVGGSSGRGWKLLALVTSAQQRFKDAETIVDIGLQEVGRIDKLELLRLKAALNISQEQPKKAMEAYGLLLAEIEAWKEVRRGKADFEVSRETEMEMESWQDLANVYMQLGSWSDADFCIKKAESIRAYSPGNWHCRGKLYEGESLYNEALSAFTVSLSIDPTYVPGMVSMARVLTKLGSTLIPIARSFLLNALRLEPANHDAWFNLALVSKTQGSTEEAAGFFQAAYELKMSTPLRTFR